MTFASLVRRAIWVVASISLLWLMPAFAERPEQLRPSNYVNDFAGVIDEATQSRLNAMCLEVQQKANAQIAIVTIKTLEDQPVEDFAVTLFKRWGIGQKGSDRGVLVLLATQDHKYRVEVGYGLESILPDGKVGGFGREMVPILRQNNYSAALTLMTTRIAQTIADDAHVQISGMLELPQRRVRQQDQPLSPLARIVLFIVIGIVILILITHPSLLFWILLNALSGGGSSSGSGGFGGGGGFGGFGGGSSGGGGASGSW